MNNHRQFNIFNIKSSPAPHSSCVRVDHGSAAKNEAAYGVAAPPDLLAQYGRIAVPCHFIMGLDDKLIAPNNVLKHFNALRASRPDLAFLHASPKGFGHVDFTLGCDDELISTVMEIFRRDLQEDENCL